ncbi:diguanylate cyclase [Pseudonocardia sp.]|uniref:diguanylate cyclase domain-containing protein n=1 Tax=Pseudonocardia sp. TaxID=60912 RepID=UPI0026136AE9|nr:diguanylate cyclase [Pseudonocardia sp.]
MTVQAYEPAPTRVRAVLGPPVAVGIVVFALGTAAVLLAPRGTEVAAWWPAAGVAVAAVALNTGRSRLLILLTVALAGFAANLAGGRGPVTAAAFALANTAEAAVAGALLTRSGPPVLRTLPDLARLFAAAAAGAVLAAGIAAGAVGLQSGGVPWTVWWSVAAGHGAAVVVLVPLVMIVPARPATVRAPEAFALWAGVIVTTVAVFTLPLPLTFVPVAVLVGTGLRLGVRTAAAQLVVVGVLVAGLSALGSGPFAQAGRLLGPGTTGALVAGFLAACALVVLALAVSASLRERATRALADQRLFERAVLAASPDVIFVIDVRTRSTLWLSRTLTELLGHRPEDVVALGGDVADALVHPEDVDRMRAVDAAACLVGDGEVRKLRLRTRHGDGGYRWISRRVTPFARDTDGTVTQLLGVARDVTENVALEERLAAAALHDPLTGLPNRRLLTDRLAIALHRSARGHSPVAVLFCDLDGFKHVNDTAGHVAGDAVLRATAKRLRAVLRPQDTVARVGGDEFVCVLDAARRTAPPDLAAAEARRQARTVAWRIVAAVAQPVDVDGTTVRVSVSVGITLARAGDDPGSALRDADRAMYRAKGRGKGRHEEFDEQAPWPVGTVAG